MVHSDDPLADSWNRLAWTKHLANQATEVARESILRERSSPVRIERVEHDGYLHARIVKQMPFEVVHELGFLIADIAVNARSCLDMAVTQLVDAHGVAVRTPQFPILDDVAKPDRSMKALKSSALPPAIVQAIEVLQPVHDAPGRRMEVPLNLPALHIRAVSNANKHRNITPTAQQVIASGIRQGVDWIELVGGEISTPWADDRNTLAELRMPVGATATDEQIATVVTSTSVLEISQSQFHFGGDGFAQAVRNGLDIPIRVESFLRLVPAYVEHALLALTYANSEGRSGVAPTAFSDRY